MKLRNKKTGEIIEIQTVDLVTTGQFCDKILDRQPSLAKLNEEWEDYTSAEPLIKDEKIRKAVRAWAEMFNCKHEKLRYMELNGENGHYLLYRGLYSIDVPDIKDLVDYEYYTLAELCGEEDNG